MELRSQLMSNQPRAEYVSVAQPNGMPMPPSETQRGDPKSAGLAREEKEEKQRSDDKKAKAIKEWLDGQDEEINNAMLVSALMFTVAASAVLQPHEANIQGTHTDIYGSLCAVSVLSCLGSVLAGTVMKRNLRYVILHHAECTKEANHFIHMTTTRFLLAWPTIMMWVGAVSMTIALMINVQEVFGETIDGEESAAPDTAAVVMAVCCVVVTMLLVGGFYIMENTRRELKLFGHYDKHVQDWRVAPGSDSRQLVLGEPPEDEVEEDW